MKYYHIMYSVIPTYSEGRECDVLNWNIYFYIRQILLYNNIPIHVHCTYNNGRI